jgi:hypothetical protein
MKNITGPVIPRKIELSSRFSRLRRMHRFSSPEYSFNLGNTPKIAVFVRRLIR